MAQPPAVACRGLTKAYGAFRALDGLDLEVAPGEVFGFLGPNGAGKTTTIRLLMGMLVPSAGEARLLDLDAHAQRVEAKRVVGYLPDDPVFPEHLRGRELLEFVGEMHGLRRPEARRRAEALLAEMDLEEAASDFANTYSMGMRRKLALACARVHEPPLYILDEPTNGLDPHAQREVVAWITAAAAAGRTVFLSTHLLDLAERICTRVGIVSRGRLLAAGAPAELRDQLCPGGSLEEVFFAVARADD
jgi:ABC-2 type transport system ATP-binding protein